MESQPCQRLIPFILRFLSLPVVAFCTPSRLVHHGEEHAVAGESRKVAHVPLVMRPVHKLMTGEMAVAAKLVAVVCILVPAEYLTDALAHHLHVSVMDEFLFAGIGNELPDLPGQRVMHVADQHKTAIGGDVRRVEINKDFLVRNNFWKRKKAFSLGGLKILKYLCT